jgi:Short repeat of unknown function (DUF308)
MEGADMSVSGSLFLRGLCALEAGAISVAWPNVTILALVAVFAFTMAATDLMLAFFSGRAGATLGFIVAAVLSAAAGVVALLWPSITALALTLWIAAWAIVSGVSEAVFAFRANKMAGERVLWIVTGLVHHRVRRRARRQTRRRSCVAGDGLRAVLHLLRATRRCPRIPGAEHRKAAGQVLQPSS